MKGSYKDIKKRLERYKDLLKISRRLTPEERVKRVFEFYKLVMEVRRTSTSRESSSDRSQQGR